MIVCVVGGVSFQTVRNTFALSCAIALRSEKKFHGDNMPNIVPWRPNRWNDFRCRLTAEACLAENASPPSNVMTILYRITYRCQDKNSFILYVETQTKTASASA